MSGYDGRRWGSIRNGGKVLAYWSPLVGVLPRGILLIGLISNVYMNFDDVITYEKWVRVFDDLQNLF